MSGVLARRHGTRSLDLSRGAARALGAIDEHTLIQSTRLAAAQQLAMRAMLGVSAVSLAQVNLSLAVPEADPDLRLVRQIHTFVVTAIQMEGV